MGKAAIVLFLVMLVAVSSCQPSGTLPPGTPAPSSASAIPAEPASTASEGEPAAECPTPTDDSLLLNHPEGGYCVLYPAEYGLAYPPPRPYYLAEQACIVPWPPSALLCAKALAFIEVESASGRTVEEWADETVAEYPRLKIERSALTLDQEPAIVLDGIQGTDKERRVLTVHGDRLYTLTFVRGRGYEQGGEFYAQGEALYSTVVGSFTFLPVE